MTDLKYCIFSIIFSRIPTSILNLPQTDDNRCFQYFFSRKNQSTFWRIPQIFRWEISNKSFCMYFSDSLSILNPHSVQDQKKADLTSVLLKMGLRYSQHVIFRSLTIKEHWLDNALAKTMPKSIAKGCGDIFILVAAEKYFFLSQSAKSKLKASKNLVSVYFGRYL